MSASSQNSTDHSGMLRKLMAVAALGLLVAGCASQPRQGPSMEGDAVDTARAKAESRYLDVVARVGLADDERAIADLEAFAARHPEFAAPWVSIAGIHEANGRFDASVDAVERALEIRPDYAPALSLLGIRHRRAGRFVEAESAYRSALDADATYALAHYNLAVLLDLYRGRPAEAVVHYRRYIELADEPDPRVARWVRDIERRHALAASGTGEEG